MVGWEMCYSCTLLHKSLALFSRLESTYYDDMRDGLCARSNSLVFTPRNPQEN